MRAAQRHWGARKDQVLSLKALGQAGDVDPLWQPQGSLTSVQGEMQVRKMGWLSCCSCTMASNWPESPRQETQSVALRRTRTSPGRGGLSNCLTEVQAEPALWREAKAEAASVNKGAWPQVRTDQLLCVSETRNRAGVHPGKGKHTRQKGQPQQQAPSSERDGRGEEAKQL